MIKRNTLEIIYDVSELKNKRCGQAMLEENVLEAERCWKDVECLRARIEKLVAEEENAVMRWEIKKATQFVSLTKERFIEILELIGVEVV